MAFHSTLPETPPKDALPIGSPAAESGGAVLPNAFHRSSILRSPVIVDDRPSVAHLTFSPNLSGKLEKPKPFITASPTSWRPEAVPLLFRSACANPTGIASAGNA